MLRHLPIQAHLMASHHTWNKIQSPHYGRWALQHLASTFLSRFIFSPSSSSLTVLQATGLLSCDKLISKPCHVLFPLLQMLFPGSWEDGSFLSFRSQLSCQVFSKLFPNCSISSGPHTQAPSATVSLSPMHLSAPETPVYLLFIF